MALSNKALTERNERIRGAMEAGNTVEEVAAKFNLAVPTVYGVLNRRSSSKDHETQCLTRVINAMDELEPEARARVVDYIAARYKVRDVT